MADASLGNVTFGVKAFTNEMDQAAAKVRAFGAAAVKVAQAQAGATAKQVEAINKAAAAHTKQEIAMRKAIDATRAFGKAVEASKLKEEEQSALLKQSVVDLNAYVAVMGKLKTSTHDASVAQQKFDSSLKTSKDAFNQAKRGGDQFADVLRNLESSAVLAVGPLSGIGARIRSLGAIASRTANIMTVVLIAAAVGVGVALWKMSAAALNAFKVFESANARFKAATGSMALARAEMNFVIKTSLELGLRIEDTAKAYSRLSAASKGSTLEGEGVRKIFLGIAKAAAALRLSQSEVEGAFRAIEQMMSKGTVQAEELRGQLGERLPGAFRLAAEAMNMTTMELGKALKAGKITAEEMLPRLAEQLEKSLGSDAANNVNSFTGSMNNLANRTLLFAQEWDRVTGTSTIFIKGIQLATSAVKLLTNSLEFIVKAVISTGIAMTFYFGGAILTGIVSGFTALRTAIMGTTIATWALNVAMLANPFGGILVLLGKIIPAIIAGGLAFLGLSYLLDDNKEALDAQAEAARAGADAIKELDKAAQDADEIGKLTKDIYEIGESMKNLKGAQGFGKSADEVKRYYDSFQEVSKLKLAGDTTEQLKIKAEALSKVLGREVAPTIDGVGAAIYRLIASEENLQRQMQQNIDNTNTYKDTIKDLEIVRARFAENSKLGTTNDDIAYFDAVTAEVMKFRTSLIDNGKSVQENADAERALREALSELYIKTKMITEAEKERSEQVKANEKSVEILAKAEQKLADLRDRLAAAQQGEAELDYYDKVTKGVNSYRDAIANANLSDRERADLLAKLEAILAQTVAAEDAITAARERQKEATKALNAEEAQHLKDVEKTIVGMRKANETIDLMKERLAALKGGPESFDVFTNVTSQVEAFRKSTQASVGPLVDITAQVAEFKKLLEDENSFKVFADMANNMANAVGTSLEGIFNGTKSVKEGFKGMLEEMWNVMLRALIIQPIMDTLSASMTKMFASNTGASTGGGSPFMAIMGGIMGAVGGGAGGGVGAGVTSLLNQPGMFAKGGTFHPNQDILVGEKGPEILRMGSRGGQIFPNDQLETTSNDQMSRNQTNNIVVNLPAQMQRRSAMQVAGEVYKTQRRATSRNY